VATEYADDLAQKQTPTSEFGPKWVLFGKIMASGFLEEFKKFG
jgi:hypothetical protein